MIPYKFICLVKRERQLGEYTKGAGTKLLCFFQFGFRCNRPLFIHCFYPQSREFNNMEFNPQEKCIMLFASIYFGVLNV